MRFYISKGYDLTIVLIVAFFSFLAEFLYYTIEQKSDVVLISTGNISAHRKNSIILLIFASLSISVTICDSGLIIGHLITGIIFGFLELRGVIFTNQTVALIRIFKQGFEYGFWNRYVCWDRILNYKISTDESEILIEKSGFFGKSITIKFEKVTDLIEFESYLKIQIKALPNKRSYAMGVLACMSSASVAGKVCNR